MELTPHLSAAIRNHAREAYPHECCGVVINGTYVPMDNLSDTPKTAFKMDLEGLEPEAIVHSHPDGVDAPSAYDMRQQRATKLPWIIIKSTEHGCKPPFVLGGPTEPLLGRVFRHGVHDCYSLIQDWFETQGQRHLTPEVPRDWEWWSKGQSLYMDHCEAAGWRPTQEPKPGCIAGIQSAGSPVINHAGVLLPGGWILHHLVGKLSCRERVEAWRPQIKTWVHHPDFVLADTSLT